MRAGLGLRARFRLYIMQCVSTLTRVKLDALSVLLVRIHPKASPLRGGFLSIGLFARQPQIGLDAASMRAYLVLVMGARPAVDLGHVAAAWGLPGWALLRAGSEEGRVMAVKAFLSNRAARDAETARILAGGAYPYPYGSPIQQATDEARAILAVSEPAAPLAEYMAPLACFVFNSRLHVRVAGEALATALRAFVESGE